MKKYIKMNNNDYYLSLGNVLRILKEESLNGNNSVQAEMFCLLFDLEYVNTTTVNNYCVGLRSIGSSYKQKYLIFKKKPEKFLDICFNVVCNINGIVVNNINKIDYIKENKILIKVINRLSLIMKNDRNVSNDLSNKIMNFVHNNDYYLAFLNILLYAILENKQPLYEENHITETVNELIAKTNISVNAVSNILKLELQEGLSYYGSLKNLSDMGNPYALYKLARMEYLGQVSGKKNLDKVVEYLEKAITYNHPASYWMLAYLMINKELGEDINSNLVWDYLNKACLYGSMASFNTMGLCYLKGITPSKKKDEKKALECFMIAANKNYVYSLNNLGKIYENKKEYPKAIEYYQKSAELSNSWACNKLGEIYRKGEYLERDMKMSFNYYLKGSDSSINEICHYCNYNLAKYFYINGCSEIMLPKNISKAISLLEKEKDYLIEALMLLFYIYYDEYKNKKNISIKDKLIKIKESIESSPHYNDHIKKEIESQMAKIKNLQSIVID